MRYRIFVLVTMLFLAACGSRQSTSSVPMHIEPSTLTVEEFVSQTNPYGNNRTLLQQQQTENAYNGARVHWYFVVWHVDPSRDGGAEVYGELFDNPVGQGRGQGARIYDIPVDQASRLSMDVQVEVEGTIQFRGRPAPLESIRVVSLANTVVLSVNPTPVAPQ